MDKTDLSEWFYNSTKDKLSDIGYWVGYRIAKSYYEKAADKTAALKDTLEFSDAQAFLAASGWRPGVGSAE